MTNKELVYSRLNELGITYEHMEHEPVYTMEDMDRLGITSKGTVCKNLFLRDAKGKVHYLVTVPEEKLVNMKDLAAQIGSTKLSFASSERLQKYLCVEQGCVSPFGVLNDESKSVIVVFDRDLQGNDAVGVHPNDNSASVWLAFSELRRVIEEHGNEICFARFSKAE